VSTYDEYLNKAERCAEKIFELNPESSKGYSLRGAIRNNRADPAGATLDFKRALALDPNSPDALLWLGYNYAVSGQVPLARALMDRLLEVDPLTSINVCVYGMVAMMDGQYEEALRLTQRSVDIDPENPTCRMINALMLAANDRVSEACTLLDAVARDTPQMAWAKLATAMACALRGDRDGVLRVMTPELREAVLWDDIFSWWTADCFAIVGERDAALDYLERAVDFGIINHPFLAQYEPFLANVRGEERFGRLMLRVRKAWETFVA
jgi:non-specific serine/threonine protein kinase